MVSTGKFMAQNSKSRIPVPVTSQKSSSVCNNEKRLIEKKLMKQGDSQAAKFGVKSITRTGKEVKLKDTAPLSGGGKVKSDDRKNKKHLPLKTNIDSNGSKHFTALKTNVKYPIHKNRIQPSSKTNVVCDSEMKKQSLIKTKKAYDDKKSSVLALNVKYNSAETKSSSSAQLLHKTSKSIDDKAKPPIVTVTSQFDDGEKLATPCHASPKKSDILDKQVCFSEQKGIVFKANELYRNMTLSGRQSPSICKQIPGFRLSSIQARRRSAYQKFEMSADPRKEALEAIKNVCLSAKRMDKSSAKENKIPVSPFKDRGCFYAPCADPRNEVMKSLRKLKQKQLQNNTKSCKKVTFNLNVQDGTPKDIVVVDSTQISEKKLTEISEKSEENTPASPQGERFEMLPLKQDNEVKISSELTKNDNCIEHEDANFTDQTESNEKDSTIKLEQPKNFTLQTPCIKYIHSPIVNDQCDKLLPTNYENVSKVPANHVQNSYIPVIEHSNIVHAKIKDAKVYTPRPISIFSKMSDSCSPEFLAIGKSAASTDLAPICTPFVLKSIAKHSMVSPETKPVDDPVRLKLDFTEVEKELPKKETFRNQATKSLKNIITNQKKLDDLADKECSLLLPNENIHVLCGRNLINPIALTLNEGDDMHFIPI